MDAPPLLRERHRGESSGRSRAPCCLWREDRGDERPGRRWLHDRPPGGESVRVAARPLLAHRI